MVYTHGHVDHVTGADKIIDHSLERGDPRPHVIGHKLVAPRFDRYRSPPRTTTTSTRSSSTSRPTLKPFTNASLTYPDIEHADGMDTRIGGLNFRVPPRPRRDRRRDLGLAAGHAVCSARATRSSGASPNAGNPYKVQRYAKDWADALEQMAANKPAHLLPGHGPALSGEGRIEDALLSTAAFLRSIHDQVVAGMNEGKWLEDIIREMDWPATDKPWLRPIYDHPEFIARNVYRLYGGWWNGDPADMLPAHSHEVAAALVGATGAAPILERARELQAEGDLQLACHLVDFVRKGDPDNREAWELWRDLFTARAGQEDSLMARGAFKYAVRMADAALNDL